MPVVGQTVVTIPILTSDHVRRFLRDYPHKNIIIDDVEFDQDEINQGIEMVTSRFNAMTPQSRMRANQWSEHLKFPLMQAVAGYLIRSAAILQLRNQATYQDGDIAPVGVDDKFPLYMQLAQYLDDQAMQTFMLIKAQNNLEGMYGSLGSGYAYVGRYHR